MQELPLFLYKIHGTLKGGGDCLIPVDSAGRLLEIAALLESIWRETRAQMQKYTLALVSNVSTNVFDMAMNMAEWMNDRIANINDPTQSLFKFDHLRLCGSVEEVERLPSPKCVLATPGDLSVGVSRSLFQKWSSDPKNSVIFTMHPRVNTPVANILEEYSIAKAKNKQATMISMNNYSRVELEGDEFLEAVRKRAEDKEAKIKALVQEKNKNQEEIYISDSDEENESESDSEEPQTYMPWEIQFNLGGKKNKHDLMMAQDKQDAGKKKVQIFKQAKKTFPMFPYAEKKQKWDHYGEAINQEEYQVLHNLDLLNFQREKEEEEELDPEKLMAKEEAPSEPDSDIMEIKKELNTLNQTELDKLDYVEDDIDILLDRPPMKYREYVQSI